MLRVSDKSLFLTLIYYYKIVAISPAARHLALRHQLNVNKIKGTGKHGLISKEDVLVFLSQKGSPQNIIEPVAPKTSRLSPK
jgi:pyruvate/2-oxoglutarate dehydrogenase complex dihydrolipoamide acyltransferase (E2) component